MREGSDNEGSRGDGSVLERSLSAGYWSVLDTLLQKILIYGGFFISARFLSPEDYGLIALAMVYPNLLDSLTAIAFDTALTQVRSGEERPYLSLVWSFNLVRVAIVFVIVAISAPFFAAFFNAEGAELLFSFAALPLLVQGFANIGQIYFFRRLDWRRVFVRDMWSYGTSALVTVALAYLTRSYWAIFIGSSAGMLAAVIATYALERTRPRFVLSFKKLAPLFPYSQWVFGQGLLSRLASTVEDMTVGHFTDPTSVGNLSKAKSLAYAPTSPLANIIGKVGFSALVAAEGSLHAAKEGFKKSFETALAVALPYSVAIWVFGTTLVAIVLGPAWMGITPLLKTLVIVSGLNASVYSIVTMTLNALGHPRLQFRLSVVSAGAIVLVLPYLAITYGISGAAFALLIASLVTNIYALVVLERTISLAWRTLARSATVTFVASLAPLVIVLPILAHDGATRPASFFGLVALYGILYGAIVLLFGTRGPWATGRIVAAGLLARIRGKKT